MIAVRVQKSESIDHALRRFKRKCEKAGLQREVKRASYYVKPSEKRKKARLAARKKVARTRARSD